MPLGIGDVAAERQRVGIAVGHQPRAFQNEGDLRVLGQLAIELGDDGGRQVQRTAFFIEPARGLDLAHLFARRHFDAQSGFDQALFVEGGLDQVQPDGVLVDRRFGRALDALETLLAEAVDGQHGGL